MANGRISLEVINFIKWCIGFEVKSLMMHNFLTFAFNKSAIEPVQSGHHSVEVTLQKCSVSLVAWHTF